MTPPYRIISYERLGDKLRQRWSGQPMHTLTRLQSSFDDKTEKSYHYLSRPTAVKRVSSSRNAAGRRVDRHTMSHVSARCLSEKSHKRLYVMLF